MATVPAAMPAKSNIHFRDGSDTGLASQLSELASALLRSVIGFPHDARLRLPLILQTNDFRVVSEIAKEAAFLEVTSPAQANVEYRVQRLDLYRRFFVIEPTLSNPWPRDVSPKAYFSLQRSRNIVITHASIEQIVPIVLGPDTSVSLADSVSLQVVPERIEWKAGLVFAIGFGKRIVAENCHQEFDAVIRYSIASWLGQLK